MKKHGRTIALVMVLVFVLTLGFSSLALAGPATPFTITVNHADPYHVNYTIDGYDKNNKLFDRYDVQVIDYITQNCLYVHEMPKTRIKDFNITDEAIYTWNMGHSGTFYLRVVLWAHNRPLCNEIVTYEVP